MIVIKFNYSSILRPALKERPGMGYLASTQYWRSNKFSMSRRASKRHFPIENDRYIAAPVSAYPAIRVSGLLSIVEYRADTAVRLSDMFTHGFS